MNTNEHEGGQILRKDLVYSIVSCAMEVLHTIGHGLHEKPYENALAVELGHRKIPFKQQSRFEVIYKGARVGEFVPDLIADESVVIDTKVIDPISEVECGPMLNYLRISRLRMGVILNFKKPKLEWQLFVL